MTADTAANGDTVRHALRAPRGAKRRWDTTSSPDAPEELKVDTDLGLRANRPFRIVDRMTAKEALLYMVAGIAVCILLGYFLWPAR